MAFNASRFSTYNAGQTGAALLAKYDGSGVAGDDGGDSLSVIKTNGFWAKDLPADTEVKRRKNAGLDAVADAVRLATDGRTTGAGLPILFHGNTGLEMGF